MAKRVWLRLIVPLVLSGALVSGCGGGGGDADSGGGINGCADWGVAIEQPTYEQTWSVSVPSVQISGVAPLASYWDDCYPCVPTSTGVDVSWANEASGVHGTAISMAETGWFFGYPLYSNYWYGIVPVIPGDNIVNVYAYEGTNLVGQDCITLTYVVDTSAPTVPANPGVDAVYANSIALSWDGSVDDATTQDAAIYYRVYRNGSLQTGSYNTSVTDVGLQSGTQYCYTISARDKAGNESLQSDTVCATTLVP